MCSLCYFEHKYEGVKSYKLRLKEVPCFKTSSTLGTNPKRPFPQPNHRGLLCIFPLQQLTNCKVPIEINTYMFSQPKICKFNNARCINKQICTFDIPVQHNHPSHQNLISTKQPDFSNNVLYWPLEVAGKLKLKLAQFTKLADIYN